MTDPNTEAVCGGRRQPAEFMCWWTPTVYLFHNTSHWFHVTKVSDLVKARIKAKAIGPKAKAKGPKAKDKTIGPNDKAKVIGPKAKAKGLSQGQGHRSQG